MSLRHITCCQKARQKLLGSYCLQSPGPSSLLSFMAAGAAAAEAMHSGQQLLQELVLAAGLGPARKVQEHMGLTMQYTLQNQQQWPLLDDLHS